MVINFKGTIYIRTYIPTYIHIYTHFYVFQTNTAKPTHLKLLVNKGNSINES